MSHFAVLVIGPDVAAQLAPFQENNMGDCPPQYLKFIEDEDARLDPKTGKKGYWENPNRKWDWWVVGGRYSDRLVTKAGLVCNTAKVGDLDLALMLERRRRDYVEAWAEIEARPYLRPIYGIPKEGTRGGYIARARALSAFAVLKNGEWFEKGEMGWWGAVANEQSDAEWDAKLDELVAGLPPDTQLTVVDCHI